MSMIKAAGLSETSVHLLSWLKSGKEIFPFTENVHNGSGAQPASYLKGYRVSLLEVKQLEREADRCYPYSNDFNPLNPELNPISYLLALLGAHHFLHVSRIRVKLLTFRRLMSYIYGAPILDVSRSHTTTQHSR